MSWKKRPEEIKTKKKLKRAIFNTGIVQGLIKERQKEVEAQKIKEERIKREERE